LVALWGAQLYGTWGAWGDVTIDSGHEMYVPALLATGKTLYRDTWFMYGPAGPYLNAYLFRTFGIHLSVLYWAGALSALGSSVMLYVTGMYLSSWVAGWTAGAVLLLEAFAPSVFCFPLPYSFSAVYGCLLGCVFLYSAVRGADAKNRFWILGAGSLAGIELLMKPEFGLACYATLLALIVVRWLRSGSLGTVAGDIAASLPGIAICVAVAHWMISLGGVEFITQENLVTWPTSYFMKTFGKIRLEETGFTLTVPAFASAFGRAIGFGLLLLGIYTIFWWKERSRASTRIRIAISAALVFYFARVIFLSNESNPLWEALSLVFFPRDMVMYVGLAALLVSWLWWRIFREGKAAVSAGLPILLVFSSALAFRILMKMTPTIYSIYYNGPVVLAFLLLLRCVFASPSLTRRSRFLLEASLCAGSVLLVAIPNLKQEGRAAGAYVALDTPRGTLRLTPGKKESYESAIRFMREKASRGQTVLSVPEDTSLYFLAETECPIRVYSLTPGVIAPGKMTAGVIQEIDSKRVDYLLWSNRIFTEYGVPVFGKDFDVELGEYLKRNYRKLGPVRPVKIGSVLWTANIWQRTENTSPP
jgi:hypothetical protein